MRYEIDTLPYEKKVDLENITFHLKGIAGHDSISFNPIRTSICIYENTTSDTIQITYVNNFMKLIRLHPTKVETFEITEITY